MCYTVTCKITERKRRLMGISIGRRFFTGISDAERDRKERKYGNTDAKGGATEGGPLQSPAGLAAGGRGVPETPPEH